MLASTALHNTSRCHNINCINLRCIWVNRKTLEFGLGYDVVMKLCKDISAKYHLVYCDNPFTSVQLLKD